MNRNSFLFYLLLALIIISCAKRGRPTGGPKDEASPIVVSARPAIESINFSEDEIRIYFDEFVKLKDLNQQLVISPPMKYQPIITPVGTPSKYINIKILDTLRQNTTYTFNFGQSIIDNTEGNILKNFKYVFSTGDYIDSLKVSGSIKDAFFDKPDTDVSILLYEYNETYTDSLIYNQKPFYVGNSLDTTVWEITNIKDGKYKLIALKDASKDYQFTPKQDKIGFLEKEITIPEDSVGHELNLFKEILSYKINRPSEQTKNRLWFGYEGKIDSTFVIRNLLEDVSSLITYEKDKDTLNYWYKGAELDSLYLEISHKNFSDTISINRRSKKVDSLELNTNAKGVLSLNDKLKLVSNVPIVAIDTTKIILTDKDTLLVKYNLLFEKNKREAFLDFKITPENKYRLELLPEAVTDFLENKNDSIQFNFRTKKPSDYGTIKITLQNAKSFPILMQLVKVNNTKEELVEEIYAIQDQEFNFLMIEPGKYKIKLIYDENKNGVWDTGNFLRNLQPEKIVYFPKELDVRANWDNEEIFILND